MTQNDPKTEKTVEVSYVTLNKDRPDEVHSGKYEIPIPKDIWNPKRWTYFCPR